MGRALGYLCVVGVLVAVFFGVADISTRSATCVACHTEQGAYADWMVSRLKAHKKGFSHEMVACAACHIEGAAAGTVLSRFRGLLHAVTYLVPQIDPRTPEISGVFRQVRIPSENCAYCHAAALHRKAVLAKDLPANLKKIGLAMDHRKHVLARDDTCAKCHERYKAQGEADKKVNYAEVNHLACDSCHTSASHAYRADHMLPLTQAEYVQARDESWNRLQTNPRWMIAIPTEQSCRRCHNGKIHYKTKIFLVDCRNANNYDDCRKCHPLMTKDFFEQYRRDRSKVAETNPNARSGG
ncbi:MAG: hypothetical protein AB1646_07315 [Thermodesulfobacteriota bacterium]